MSNTLLNAKQVCQATTLSRGTLYALISRGLFPKPIRIAGTRRTAWPSDVVQAWIAAQTYPSQHKDQ